MFFADYVTILKEHFKQPISNDELCGILFDAIILSADLKNRNGEILTVDKAEVSRIMNLRKNIPTALQEHVWDKKVQAELENYFEQQIVSELVPDTSDLLHQLMNLIEEDENISSENKNKFRLLAKQKSIALFLAEAFSYVIRQKNKLVRKSINKSERRTSVQELRNQIFQLYGEISLPTDEEKLSMLSEKLYWSKEIFIRRFSVPVKISERVKKKIRDFAEKIRFDLPEKFFDLQGIRRGLIFDRGKIIGSNYGKMKFEKIKSLVRAINLYRENFNRRP
ncbi:MAG: hypothetical protein IJL14_10560 [Selenomonadaceae bacterium]|nr:hypothetical protein [Selenomonadaceae bacterium]